MKYSKREAIKIIVNAAHLYNKNLKDKELLVIAKNKNNLLHYNIIFKDYNFKHLTGVESKLSAGVFFHNALNNQLSIKDFEFKDNYLAEKKMRILENAVQFPYSAKMVGDFNYSGIKIQADVGAGSPNYVMAFRINYNKGNLYPVSILEEDIRDASQPTSPIVAILSKNKDEILFDNITYHSHNINISKLHIPKAIKAMISQTAYYKLKSQGNNFKTI